MVPRHAVRDFFSLPMKDWIIWNLQDKGNFTSDVVEWQSLFGMLCWQLWKNRNEAVFSNGNRSLHAIVDSGRIWARSYRDLDMRIRPMGSMEHLLQ